MKKTFYIPVLTLFLLLLPPTLSSIFTPSDAPSSSQKRSLPHYPQQKDSIVQTATLASPSVEINSLSSNMLSKKQSSVLLAKGSSQSIDAGREFNLDSLSQTLNTLQKKYVQMSEQSNQNDKNQSNIDNGQNNKINGTKNIIQKGNNNQIQGHSNLVDGNNNTIKGRNNLVLGQGNVIIDALPPNFTNILRNPQKINVLQNTEFMDLVPTQNKEKNAILYSSNINLPKSSQQTALNNQLSAQAIRQQQTFTYKNKQEKKKSQTKYLESGGFSNKNLKIRDITLDEQVTTFNSSNAVRLKEKNSQTIPSDNRNTQVSLGDKQFAKVVSILLIFWIFCF